MEIQREEITDRAGDHINIENMSLAVYSSLNNINITLGHLAIHQ